MCTEVELRSALILELHTEKIAGDFQVWQWVRHQTRLEEDHRVVSRRLVNDLTMEVMVELRPVCHSAR